MNFLPPQTVVEVSLESMPPLNEFEEQWRALETRAESSFFTSWTWIGSWLRTLPAKASRPRVLRARVHDQVVGLAVVGQSSKRSIVGPRPIGALNQTGLAADDVIYIEYNDVLVDRDCASAARRAMLDAIMTLADGRAARWSEFCLSGITPPFLQAITRAGVRQRLVADKSCPWVDLHAVSPGLSGYLAVLSRNTRQQINQTLRLLETDGPVRAAVATDPASALAALHEMRELHQNSWQQRKGHAGAFASARFCTFAEALVSAGTSDGSVQLIRVTAGPATVGVLMNFVHRGHVYAYQSGFAYRSDNRYRPGLVSHALAVAKAREQASLGYHFMAGEGRYKSSLANASEQLFWVILRHDDPLSRIEDFARQIKARIGRSFRELRRQDMS